ncbi:MAG: dTDP-4-dehydrorhamnose reductase [Flavobacteriaceae bacterium]|nr:dTDP-4-dehydrorhamnose reductase [Flavobacteriaceae bacterium]
MLGNILVTGCNGQLGSEFKNIASKYPDINFFFKDLDLDISNKEDLENYILNKKINVILNTAAYTNVNNAEIEKNKANLINSFAVKNLVELSEKYNCKVIHYSTDYVYGGFHKKPMKESFPANPLNYYGISKRNGEIFIEKSYSESIIIRTSWLYSFYGNNFVNTIIEKAKKESEIHVVNDQFGCPTHAKDLALDTINILKSKLKLDFDGKVYNYSNLGSTSWSNFAKKIIELSKIECKIHEVSSTFFKSTIKRPKYSITNKDKIISNFNLNIPKWKHSLKAYLTSLKP